MSTPTPPSGPGRPVGATPVGARDDGRKRRKGLLWGALALLALLLVALLLSQCGGDDPEGRTDSAGATSGGSASSGSASPESSDPSSESASSSSAGSSGADTSAGGGGQIVADDQSVLDLAAGGNAAAALAELDGQDATGTGVQVLAVPADEGFWVGSSDSDRVWVQLTGAEGESPYQVQEGDTVDFQGTVVTHDEAFASEVGVDEDAGAGQLTEQGSHLEVAKGAVQLSE